MTSRFYLTLPSNSSAEYYPDNTVAQFSTKLAKAYELDGDWEVGLVEIVMPSEIENVYGHEFSYTVYRDGEVYLTVYVNNGLYNRATLMQELYGALKAARARKGLPFDSNIDMDVHFQQSRNRIMMTVGNRLIPKNVNMEVKFSEPLAYMMQFDANRTYPKGVHTSNAQPVMNGRTYPVMVYCDILEHVPVGDTLAPLLRMVDPPTRETGTNRQTFNPILYVPLSRKTFDAVSIHIMTDTAKPVPFLSGTSHVVLEFRRKTPSLLTL